MKPTVPLRTDVSAVMKPPGSLWHGRFSNHETHGSLSLGRSSNHETRGSLSLGSFSSQEYRHGCMAGLRTRPS